MGRAGRSRRPLTPPALALIYLKWGVVRVGERVHRRRRGKNDPVVVGGAVGRDELGDPGHPQHRSIQPAVWRVVRVAERVHRRWQLHRGRGELCRAVGRDSWAIQTIPNPEGSQLSGVSCVSPSA